MPDTDAASANDGGLTLLDREGNDVTGHHWVGQVSMKVEKYNGPNADLDALNPEVVPDEIVETLGNLIVNNGVTRLLSLLTGAGGQAITSTSARVGVGDSATAETNADADLGAAAGGTHRQFETATVSTATRTLTLVAVFTTGEANFAWAEWGIDIGAPTVAAGTTVNTLFNHKVVGLGTKTSASAWTFTVTVTW